MAERILIVDDEETILDLLEFHLQREGYRTLRATDGETALSLWETEQPEAVILDIMLPGADGLTVARTIRRSGMTPVILVSARGEEADRVRGLDIGADDYIVKPFSPRELLARVRAVLRRSREGSREVVEIGDLVVDLDAQSVTREGRAVALTYTEFALLRCLIAHRGRVLTRPFLLEKVWGFDFYGDSRTVDVHVRHLREKIERDPAHPAIIETVRGVGYRLRAAG